MTKRYAISLLMLSGCFSASAALSADPTYTAEGALGLPKDYREWVFLTSSLDLNYDKPVPGAGRQSLLDNVFVNPEAYSGFLRTGTWPDKTVMVKENRKAVPAGSIAKDGKMQTSVVSMELHVKDEFRFPGGWAFFVSDGHSPGKLMPPSAECYSCHKDHGATDTTFVQFYPTLIDIAKSKGTYDAAK